MNLFTSAGTIVQLPSDSQLLGIYLQDIFDPSGVFTFQNRLAVITGAAVQESSLFQLRTMFNDRWYINVFGDNPGVMSISGMFAGGICGSDTTNGRVNTSGFELITAYYRQHRLSNRMLALPVAIGGFMTPIVYEAFLAECQISAVDPQLQVGQFTMKLVYPMHVIENPSAQGGDDGDNLPDGNDDGEEDTGLITVGAANALLP